METLYKEVKDQMRINTVLDVMFKPDDLLYAVIRSEAGFSTTTCPREIVEFDDEVRKGAFSITPSQHREGVIPVDVTPPTFAESEVKPPTCSSWWVLMGNLENNHLVSLGKVSNAGPPGAKPQTRKLQIQAPPNAGSWKFYAFVKNDSNMGCDLTIEMTLTVIDAPELSAEIIEDDTSEPGEDTIAGQKIPGERVMTAPKNDEEAEVCLDAVLGDHSADNETENPELAKLIQSDSPLLVKQIYSIVESMKSAKDKLMDLQQRISSNSVPTSKGVSLLEIKLHGLLSYLTNLSFFILLKLHGQSTSELHPSVGRLIEMRVILEKIKPMEVNLKYQIDKVLKAANDASNPSAEKDAQRNVSEFDLQNSRVSDPLQFKPNPLNLVGASTALDKNADQSREEGGVYRPPRIDPVKYSEEPKRRKGDLSASTRESLSKSRLFKDMRDTFDTSRPEQGTSHGTGYGVCELRDSKDEELAMIEEFELSNYQRLSEGIVDEMENLESDFLQMDALDRAVSYDNQERYGSSGSVLAKRNMRAESFFTGNDEPRKKGKFADATELVTKVASGAAGKKTAYDNALRKASKPRHRTLAKK
ncbi:hypothetical protein CcCBS67573_g08622 [Chytriomyces confervae]|uniref:Sas10 C-terminal domain-containing protein n=1 Tax=Chytriomyces confervae TaxID=246404 RepID=A0A507EKB1_9FUNG|nr:hypothetical protein CcCBS67573_g08622 [Chytriomyces confervae]